jgi:hypothetical protein
MDSDGKVAATMGDARMIKSQAGSIGRRGAAREGWRLLSAAGAAVLCLAGVALADDAPARERSLQSEDGSQRVPVRALERVLVEGDLSSSRVEIVALDGEGVTVREGASGAQKRVPMSRVAAILPAREQASGDFRGASEPERMFIDTADGQSLPGMPGAARPERADVLAWGSSFLGPIVLPVDGLSRVVLKGGRPRGVAGSDDVVRLTNGDVLRGIATVVAGERGAQAWSVEAVDGGGAPTVVSMARVLSVSLANPAKEASGAWVWLAEGTAARCQDVSFGASGLASARFLVGGAEAERTEFDATLLRAFTPRRERVRALATLARSQAQGQRGWAPVVGDVQAAPLGLADVEFPGPGACAFELPTGAVRVAARVELPVSSRVWGDCDVAVLCDGRELWRGRVWADSPEATFAIDLPARASVLVVRVEEGRGGPIEDRVLLREAMVGMEEVTK